jgi:hypothetical protein
MILQGGMSLPTYSAMDGNDLMELAGEQQECEDANETEDDDATLDHHLGGSLTDIIRTSDGLDNLNYRPIHKDVVLPPPEF